MSSEKAHPHRTIANDVMSQCFGEISPESREELSVSIVRQWITNQGKAHLMTMDHHFWLSLNLLEDGRHEVVRDVQPNLFIEHMRRSRVFENDIPRMLHELNIRQAAQCQTDYGEQLQLRVEPREKRFHIELIPDHDRNP